VGLEDGQAVTWNVFSESIKPGGKTQSKEDYKLYESIVDILRPGIRKGVKSILIATPEQDSYNKFMDHIKKHQGWMLKGWNLNIVTPEHVPVTAMNVKQVRKLVDKGIFREKLREVSQGDAEQIITSLERRLNDEELLENLKFSLKEVEEAVYGNGSDPEYILVTEDFLYAHKRRTYRLLQIAENNEIKTRIIKTNTPVGNRISQFGGLVCMLKEPS
jgi:stalled ribosome rescue protein Dom34